MPALYPDTSRSEKAPMNTSSMYQSMYQEVTHWFNTFASIKLLTSLLVLLLVAVLVWVVVHKVVMRILLKLVHASKVHFDDLLVKHQVHKYLGRIAPAAVLHLGIGSVVGLPMSLVDVVRNVAMAYIILMVIFACSALLSAVNETYQQTDKYKQSNQSIKGYVQLGKLLLYLIGGVFVVSALIGRSPLLLFTGIGAMGAVLLLIFKDTILSLVASVQLTSNDIIRVGDWVEIPSLGVDGDVTDMALHTITVRNFDKTLSYVPTSRFISDPVKNWRGMKEMGARRIKRELLIDTSSIRFLTAADMERFGQIALLRDYMAGKENELAETNSTLPAEDQSPINTHKLTNIGTFRAYVVRYLQQHPHIHHDASLALMVRQLAAGEHGLPLELYCFAKTTVWSEYEMIQSDIFDHLMAILPEFDLQVYQQPSNAVVAGVVQKVR